MKDKIDFKNTATEQLHKMLSEKRNALAEHRVEVLTKKSNNTALIPKLRKEIAAVLTEISKREKIGEQNG
jgi:ribosomal protein L29